MKKFLITLFLGLSLFIPAQAMDYAKRFPNDTALSVVTPSSLPGLESDPLSWHLIGDQPGISGTKSGTYNLSTTGTLTAEQLTSTDDANIADHLNIGNGATDGLITVSAEGSMNYLTLGANDAGTSDIYSVEQLYFRCADNDFTFMHNLYTGAYFRINLAGTNPLLTSSTGIFDFDNDNITTTGTLGAGLTTVTDIRKTRSGTVTYTSGQLTQVAKTGGRTINYTYNGDGTLNTANDGTYTWTYTYSSGVLTGWNVT